VFNRIGHLTYRRRRLVLVLSAAFVVLSIAFGTQVFSLLNSGGYTDPSSESELARVAVEEDFGFEQPNSVFILTPDEGDLDDPAVVAEAEHALELVSADPDVTSAFSYWSLGSLPQLASRDGSEALMLATVLGDTDTETLAAQERLEERLGDEVDLIEIDAAGEMAVNAEVTETIEGDLARAESIAIPITLLLLMLVFGGLVAAGLPLLIGMTAIVGTLLVLFAIAAVADVSIFSINLVTALGLGLAIDYSLFMVSRFREELAARPPADDVEAERALVEAAVVRTIETAGRTVAFSALTVAVSLAALLVFPMYFLRSFAYAGVGVTLVAAASSLFMLGAVLAMVGRRIDSLSFRRSKREARVAALVANPEQGRWYRTARFSQRHAWVVVVGVVAFLIVLGLPFARVAFGVPDERVLAADADSRVATEGLREDFDTSEAEAFPIVLLGEVEDAEVQDYAVRISSFDGVSRVDAPTGRYVEGEAVGGADPLLESQRSEAGVRLSVVPDLEPISAEAEDLIGEIRDLEAPGEALVGGMSASFVDSKDSIADRLPWALAMIATTTFVLLFLMFGSVLVPLKAIVLNVLSLSATFGAMVWVFQWGHGAGLLDFTPTGLTDLSTPILMFCVAFGLSMDYEVFLLSRISEEYHRCGDNESAVALGLQRTGRIVTAAAALLSVTFLAFATSSITFVKLFGLGLALAVLMDATVVRGLLVPAFMSLAGDANWWAPHWMKRIHERLGLSEVEKPTEGAPGPGSDAPRIGDMAGSAPTNGPGSDGGAKSPDGPAEGEGGDGERELSSV
jgi:RND superfamily putative drug exporter